MNYEADKEGHQIKSTQFLKSFHQKGCATVVNMSLREGQIQNFGAARLKQGRHVLSLPFHNDPIEQNEGIFCYQNGKF